MTYGELARRLRALGMVNLDEGKRHEKWLNPTNQRVTSVPRHRKAIPTGTLHAILKQLGLTLDDLLNP